MFGGVGFFTDGAMFALIADGVFYHKTNDSDWASFERAGCDPFVYKGKGQWMVMHYHSVPDDLLDDAEEMRRWARRSFASALAPAAAKPKKPPARKTPVVTKERRMPTRTKPRRRR